MDNYGILSLAPALIAVILAFITREALFSILCGVLVGLLITGQDLLFGFTGIIQSALGNADFIWVIGIEVFIGIMVAFFHHLHTYHKQTDLHTHPQTTLPMLHQEVSDLKA